MTLLLLLLGCPPGDAPPIGDDDDSAEPGVAPVDADGDGFASEETGGEDCNDGDPEIHPDWQLPDPAERLAEPLRADVVDGVDNDCDGEVDEGPFLARFGPDVLPIFAASCAANQCHHAPAGPEGLSLDGGDVWGDLVDAPATQSALVRVAPGDPLGSYLWHKLTGTQLEAGGYGETMPFDQPPLEEAELDAIYRWILEGAEDN